MSRPRYNHDDLLDNVLFRYILKRNDPVVPPTQSALFSLETKILECVEESNQESTVIAKTAVISMLQRKGAVHATVLFALLILTLGFVVGQVSSVSPNASLLSINTSHLAFADESLWQSIGVTDTQAKNFGDNDDNAE